VIIGLAFLIGLVSFSEYAHSQQDLEDQCQIEVIDSQCSRVSQQECQRILEQCRDYFEERGAALESSIRTVQQRERSFQSEIQNLSSRIQSLETQVQRSNILIRDLSF
jgi:predicted  nucleic acid-binding Zn-ribbon protein